MTPASSDAAPRGEVREISVPVAGRAARAFVGGAGECVLLVHGGWGGARMHWRTVWDRLAERYKVVAPDLPGIGRFDQAALGSVGAYARWLVDLLDGLDVTSAWCVGNSFGASVACRFGTDFPERTLGVVLVNGIPLPPTPPLLRWLGERRLGHRIMRSLERRVAYEPAALERGFFDSSRAPEELRSLLRAGPPPQLDAFVKILVHGGARGAERLAPLLLWGEDDRLLGSKARDARKLHASWPGSKLVLVPRAGHMPQVENPDAFVAALARFIDDSSPDKKEAR